MKPDVIIYQTPVRQAAPQAIALARGLGWLHGKAIRGDNGAIRYGMASADTDRTSFTGYAFPPQIFKGWDPRKVAGGTIRPDPAHMPGETLSPAGTPLARAMETLTYGIPG